MLPLFVLMTSYLATLPRPSSLAIQALKCPLRCWRWTLESSPCGATTTLRKHVYNIRTSSDFGCWVRKADSAFSFHFPGPKIQNSSDFGCPISKIQTSSDFGCWAWKMDIECHIIIRFPNPTSEIRTCSDLEYWVWKVDIEVPNPTSEIWTCSDFAYWVWKMDFEGHIRCPNPTSEIRTCSDLGYWVWKLDIEGHASTFQIQHPTGQWKGQVSEGTRLGKTERRAVKIWGSQRKQTQSKPIPKLTALAPPKIT